MTDRICAVEGCERPHRSRGWCSKHYKAWWRFGDPLHAERDTTWERFWPKVDVGGPLDCWEWTAYRARDGYGRFGIGGRSGRIAIAHRVAFELLRGPIPEGMTLDHLCRNRGCVNPRHLEPVTQRVNSLRSESLFARRARWSACANGHPFTPENTYIRANGCRQCRACDRDAKRGSQA